MRKQFRTNLRCGACVAKIAPAFDADPAFRHWSADVASPDKTLTVEGDAIDPAHVNRLLQQAGYESLGEIEEPASAGRGSGIGDRVPQNSIPVPDTRNPSPGTREPQASYFPLLLILLYLLASVFVFEWSQGRWDSTRAMRHFMAGFFLVFSFFKLLNFSAFADAFSMYDVMAKRSRGYALAYPFIELSLGLAYLAHVIPTVVNLATLIVMGIGTVGVVQSLLNKRRIQCACLGTVFNLPMSTVTLVEDVLMAGMAAWMLVAAAS